MIRVELSNRQDQHSIDTKRLRQSVRHVLEAEGWQDAEVSLAVVDDPTIHELNRRYLGHDYPTDVLSFLLSDDGARRLEGEVVVSADTAARSAEQFGWTAGDELLLYVIHGTLHLAGYDDQSPDDLARMRDRERTHLAAFGLQPRY